MSLTNGFKNCLAEDLMVQHFLKFEECTPKQLTDAFALRQQVFVIEQKCFYEDIDGYDSQAYHLFLYDGNILSGYLRYFEPGVKFTESSIGRIVVNKNYRGGEIGKKLIRSGITHAMELHPNHPIRIEAQAPLVKYYRQYGFKPVSEIYQVDDIPHIQMLLEP